MTAVKLDEHCYESDLDNLDNIDLHLLRCLQVLVSERNVTHAAQRLGMRQPTLSGALARLRAATGDPLLVRCADGMAPTPVAVELARHASIFLGQVQSTLSAQRSFDPKTAAGTIRVLATDYFAVSLFSDFIAKIHKTAPRISIKLVSNLVVSAGDWLEREDGDLALCRGRTSDLPPSIYVRKLCDVPLSCIVSADHQKIRGSLSLEQYVAFDHLAALGFGGEVMGYERRIDEMLAARGLNRRYAGQLQTSIAIPKIVAQTDLISTIPTDLAKKAAAGLPLQVLCHPLPLRAPEIIIAWHLRSNRDPLQRWIRSMVLEGVQEEMRAHRREAQNSHG